MFPWTRTKSTPDYSVYILGYIQYLNIQTGTRSWYSCSLVHRHSWKGPVLQPLTSQSVRQRSSVAGITNEETSKERDAKRMFTDFCVDVVYYEVITSYLLSVY